MKRKITLLILLLIMVGVSLLMLIQPGENRTLVHSTNGASLSVSWWGNDERHEYTLKALDLFQKKYDNIAIKSRYGEWGGFENKMNMWMNSHTESDVMLINYAWLSMYSSDGEGFYDMNLLSDVVDFSNFIDSDLECGTVNGKLNAIPIAYNTPTIYYNETMYNKYGLEIPTSYEDLFAAAEVMSKDQVYPLGMSEKQLIFLLFSYYEQKTGFAVTDKNGNFHVNEDGIAMMLELYKTLIEEKVVMPLEDFKQSSFANESVAGAVAWISDASNYCSGLEASGAVVQVGEYLKMEDAKRLGWYYKPATMYAISKNTKYPKEAGQLLDYLLNDKEVAVLQKLEKGMPVSSSAVKVLQEKEIITGYEKAANDKMQENSANMSLISPIMEDSKLLSIIRTGADEYLYQIRDVNEEAKRICEEIRDYIETK